MISSTVKNFIDKYKLSGTFIVAFSGGYDSMCLADVLYKLNYDIVCVHLNHNWRGKESFEEAQACENFAKLRNIKFYCETLKDVKKTENDARNARYEFFRRCAEKFNSEVVFTAHNFDDNAETVLYRIIKGTGTIGLQGIAEKREIFYRPLLAIPREIIEKYCRQNSLNPNKDSSNDNTKYKRNLIRHKIMPLMREINPKVNEALNKLSYLCLQDNMLISKYMEKDIKKADSIEQKRLIRELLIDNGIEYDKKKVEKIYLFLNKNKASKSGKKMSLSKDLSLYTSENKTEIIKKNIITKQEVRIKKCGEYKLDKYVFTINKFDDKISEFPQDKEFKAYIEIDKIDFILRHRKDGDKIHPLGMKGTQKLKKYLNEKKIPQHEKDDLIFLCQNNEVVWAAGIGISENVKVKRNPTHIISLRQYEKN